MDWQAAGVVIAAIAVLGAYLSWYVGVIVESKLSEFAKELNGTFVRSAGSEVTGAEVVRRLEAVERPWVARQSA